MAYEQIRLRNYIVSCGPFFKHPKFKSEEEFRVVLVIAEDSVPHGKDAQRYYGKNNFKFNWNIDFIYFNKNRSYKETTFPLVTFSEKSPSLLKRYQSMPYRQYKSNPTVAMATDFQMFIANLDSVGYNTQYSCHIENMSNDWTFDYTSDECYSVHYSLSPLCIL